MGRGARKLRVMMLGVRGFPGIQGGCERHVEQLADHLARQNCDVEVVCRSAYIAKGKEIQRRGLRTVRIWSPSSQGLEAMVHTLLGTLYAAIKRPDVLHIHSIGPALCAPLARLLGIRVVVTHHGQDYVRDKWGGFGRFILQAGERLGMRWANTVIVISRYLQNFVAKTYERETVLIPNGVPIAERVGSTAALESFGIEAGRYVLLVAGFRAEKRHADLIRAFGKARPEGWKLVLVGSADPPDQYLRDTRALAESTPNVVCTGLQSGTALRELYSHAGLFVLPSSMEGLPIALLEALSYGLPVLASDIPEHLELNLDGRRYFPQGNIDALAELLRSPGELAITEEEAQRQRDWVSANYDWTAIARQTLTVYQGVCGLQMTPAVGVGTPAKPIVRRPSRTPLRAGIIGFGRMGVTHAAILNRHPDVQIGGISDTSKFILSNLRKFADFSTYTDTDKMIREADLDFIVVCTPTKFHAQVVQEAASNGIHIFMEKPLAVTYEEGRQLIEVAESAEIVNQVGYFLRFNEIFAAVKKSLDAGHIGDVIHYKNEMYGRTVIRPWKSGWRREKAMGGGCALDYASHAIDLSQHLFGPIQHVSGSVVKEIFSRGVEDAVYSNVIHPHDVSGNLIVNWSDETYRRPFNRMEIQGTRGKIIADRQELRIYVKEAIPEAGFQAGWNIRYLTDLAEGTYFELRGSEYTNQLHHFVACIKDRSRKVRCNFADALHTDFVIEQIFADAEETRSRLTLASR